MVQNPELTTKQWLVRYLRNHRNSVNGGCKVTYRQLSSARRAALKTIQYAMDSLIQDGTVEVVVKGRGRVSSVYRVDYRSREMQETVLRHLLEMYSVREGVFQVPYARYPAYGFSSNDIAFSVRDLLWHGRIELYPGARMYKVVSKKPGKVFRVPVKKVR